MTSSVPWREYQQKSADFFRRLGLTASIEFALEGARGTHAVDVFVEGKYHGIEFKWIVECKAWASSVPKEKVMALAAIVQDVGADRGFLLSETGFQSGAVRAATKTNITLSSLADLTAETEGNLIEAAMASLNWRLFNARTRLHGITKQRYDDEFFPPTATALGQLGLLELMMGDAAKNEYPISLLEKGKIHTIDELLVYANDVITAAEKWSPSD